MVGPVPTANQARGMVETSLEAVALCGASLLSDAFAPVPSPSERGFLNSSPQAEPSVQISCTGMPLETEVAGLGPACRIDNRKRTLAVTHEHAAARRIHPYVVGIVAELDAADRRKIV